MTTEAGRVMPSFQAILDPGVKGETDNMAPVVIYNFGILFIVGFLTNFD